MLKFIAGNKKILIISLFLALLIVFNSTYAQTPDSTKTYRVYLEPYFFGPSMSGTVGVGNLPNTFICAPASQLLKYFKIGGMLYAEVHNNRFAFTSDLVYAEISQDASTKNGVISGTADKKQFLWELDGLYRLNYWLEAGLGARFNNFSTGLNLNVSIPGGGTANKSGSKVNSWIDPLIVTRLTRWIDKKWVLWLRADIGGFGVGSKLAYQLQPTIGYRASKLLQISLGYRFISMDYDNNKSGSDRFLYDMQEYGPQFRIGFNL